MAALPADLYWHLVAWPNRADQAVLGRTAILVKYPTFEDVFFHGQKSTK